MMISAGVLAVLLLLSIVLLVLGLRGRRFGDHPHCPRCNFDLHGVVDAGAGRGPPALRIQCIECGKVFPRTALRRGERRRRRGLVISGGAMLLLVMLPSALLAWATIAGPAAAKYKPAWWLEVEARYAPNSVQEAAVQELVTRYLAGAWSDEGLGALAKHHLSLGQPTSSWSRATRDVMDAASKQGIVAVDDLARLFFAESECFMEFKQRVRVGQALPMRFGMRPRDDSSLLFNMGMPPFFESHLLRAEMIASKQRIDVVDAAGNVVEPLIQHEDMSMTLRLSASTTQVNLPVSIPRGSYRIRGKVVLDIPQQATGSVASSAFRSTDSRASSASINVLSDAQSGFAWTVNIDQPFEVVGPDEPVVRLVCNEEAEARVRKAFAKAKLITWGGEPGKPQRRSRLFVGGEGATDVFAYYDVEIEEDLGARSGPVRRWNQLDRGGRSTSRAGSVITVGWCLDASGMTPNPLAMPIRAQSLRLRLSPNLERAEQSFEVPVTAGQPVPELDGCTIVIEPLDVERRQAADPDQSYISKL